MIIKVRCGIDGHRQEIGRIEVDRHELIVHYLTGVGTDAIMRTSGNMFELMRAASSKSLKSESSMKFTRPGFDQSPPDGFVAFWCPKQTHGDVKVTAANAQHAVWTGADTVIAERL